MADNTTRRGCDFCTEDRDGYMQMVGAFYLTDPFHRGYYFLHGGKCKSREINFCPMCGRDLRGDTDVERD